MILGIYWSLIVSYFPYDLAVLDFETTDIKRPPHEITEIGAVKLGRDFSIKAEFTTYVRPAVIENITAPIYELTGISQDTVKDKRPFLEVFPEFRDWVLEGGSKYKTMLAAWGTHFDIPLLVWEINRIGAEYPFYYRVFDVKSFAVGVAVNFGFTAKASSLQKMCDFFEVEFIGDAHRALVDAKNTARLLLGVNDFLDKKYGAVNAKS